MKKNSNKILAIALAAVLIGVAALSVKTQAEPAKAADEALPAAHHGMHPEGEGPMFGPMGEGHGPLAGLDIEQVRDTVRDVVVHGIGKLSVPFILRPDVREKIKLTDDQAKQLRAIQDAKDRDAIGLESKTKLAELELRKLINPDVKPERGKIMSSLDEIGKLRTEQSKLDVDRILSVREVLTPEQLTQIRQLAHEQMKEHREQIRDHLKKMRGHHEQGPQGHHPAGAPEAGPPSGPGAHEGAAEAE